MAIVCRLGRDVDSAIGVVSWLPTSGFEGAQYVILPGLTLAAFSLATIARTARAALIEVLDQDYVRTARAKGLAERLVTGKHALRNALIPLVAVVGLQFGYLLGSSVVTETVFSWPGLGWLLVDAIKNRDLPVVQVDGPSRVPVDLHDSGDPPLGQPLQGRDDPRPSY